LATWKTTDITYTTDTSERGRASGAPLIRDIGGTFGTNGTKGHFEMINTPTSPEGWTLHFVNRFEEARCAAMSDEDRDELVAFLKDTLTTRRHDIFRQGFA
jgi:hypothetical protein